MQREVKITDQEAEDDEQANQTQRQAAERRAQTGNGAGRPKRNKAELLADVMKLVRDRANMIQDKMDKAERSMTDLMAEVATSGFGANGVFVFMDALCLVRTPRSGP